MGISMMWAGYRESSCLGSSEDSICLDASSCAGGIAQVMDKTPRPAHQIGSIIGHAVRKGNMKAAITLQRPMNWSRKGERGKGYEDRGSRKAAVYADNLYVTSRRVDPTVGAVILYLTATGLPHLLTYLTGKIVRDGGILAQGAF